MQFPKELPCQSRPLGAVDRGISIETSSTFGEEIWIEIEIWRGEEAENGNESVFGESRGCGDGPLQEKMQMKI